MKFINEIDSEKVFVRNFLDSMDKSKIITEKFGSIRILNLSVNHCDLKFEYESEELEDFLSMMTPVISFYSNLNQCRTVNLTTIANNPQDNVNLQKVNNQIKKFINPLLIVLLGNESSLQDSRDFAQKINYDFINSQEFFIKNKIKRL